MVTANCYRRHHSFVYTHAHTNQFLFGEQLKTLPPSRFPPSLRVCIPPFRQRERAVHALSCCHGGRRQGFVLHNIFKGAPFIPSTTTGKGKRAQPRKDSIASETLLVNPTKSGHPAGGMSSGVHGNSWCDARECTLWLSESWKLHPSNGITISSAQSS